MGANDGNLMSFDVDLAEFAKKIGLAPKLIVQRITLDLFGRITKRTPVDTGRARASWDIKEGSPSSFTPPAGASKGTADVTAAIGGLDGEKVVFITSTLDYMQYLEKGSSKQAPSGMVLLSIAEIEIEIEYLMSQL
jgi:hypothetical protein